MLASLKSMFSGKSGDTATLQLSPEEQAIRDVLEEKYPTDKLIGAKMGSKVLTQKMIDNLTDEDGVHMESILCALSALAGYACQACVREDAIQHGLSPNRGMEIIQTKDDKTFYYGDAINHGLVASKYSVWSLAAGAAKKNGLEKFPDIKALFAHVAKTIGSDEFGVVRIDDEHDPHASPVVYLKEFWYDTLPLFDLYCFRPKEWVWLIGMSIQEILFMGKDALPMDLALNIIMESAVPMSKVDFDTL